MSDLDKILLTAATTILGGATLFMTTQVFTKIFLEPLFDLRKTIRDISYNLDFFAAVIRNAPVADANELNTARETFRTLFAQLSSVSNSLPLYWLFTKLKFIPSKKDVDEAVRCLIRLSNTSRSSTYEITNEFYDSITMLLKLR
ncbi:MAG: hypothetical protein ABSA44_03190 [Bacteroidota bacterium]